MQALTLTEHGGPEVLKMREIPEPVPGPGEVVIRTKAIGVNFADIYRRRGQYSVEGPSPYVLGHEAAGVIVAVGPSGAMTVPVGPTPSATFRVGDRVAFAHVARSNAELVIAPAWKVVPLPEAISFETAAAVMLQGLTAHYLTHDSYAIQAGDTVLVHSISGGVGLLLAQIAKLKGAKVFGTVSDPSKIDLAIAAGAERVIVRDQSSSWLEAIQKLTNGRGVDVVYDGIGKTLPLSIRAAKSQGTAVYFGWAGGNPPPIDPQILMDDSKKLVGGELWSHIADREALLARSKDLFRWIEDGKIKVNIFKKFQLAEGAQAHRELEGAATRGKILLIS
jgi:NADPH2:quinone reductase